MPQQVQLDPTLIGKKFTAMDPNIEYTCVGFGQNETFLVFGAHNDVPNNRFKIKSIKMSDANFIGLMP